MALHAYVYLRAAQTEFNELSETEKKHGLLAQVYNPATWNTKEIWVQGLPGTIQNRTLQTQKGNCT